jgi:hypothetical protein
MYAQPKTVKPTTSSPMMMTEKRFIVISSYVHGN